MPASRQFRIEQRRILDPQERASEVLFGLIMVLTFTQFPLLLVDADVAVQ